MQYFFICNPDEEAAAKKCAYKACFKIMKDFIYEARAQAVVDYYAKILKISIKKKAAVPIHLDKEQYMKVNINTNLL